MPLSAFLSVFTLQEHKIPNNINNYKKTVLNIANENGLLTGTRSKKHFVQDIEWDILRKIPDLSSVEINIQGSVANIAIKRTTKEEKVWVYSICI